MATNIYKVYFLGDGSVLKLIVVIFAQLGVHTVNHGLIYILQIVNQIKCDLNLNKTIQNAFLYHPNYKCRKGYVKITLQSIYKIAW